MTELFAFPKYLISLITSLILVFVVIKWLPQRKQKLLRVIIDNPQLQKILISNNKKNWRGIKSALLAVGLIFLSLSLPGPQWGVKSEEVPQLGGNLVVCMDISDSMLAQDIKPSRFERSKIEILQAYANKNSAAPFRVGLVTFAGKAYLQCPLTLDTEALKFIFQTAAPGTLPYPGTNISAALKIADQLLSSSSGSRDVLIVSDGEDHEGDARQMIAQLLKNKIKVSVLWSGNPQGEPIPMTDENGGFVGYKKDKNGNTVISRSESATLENIARQTGGKFIRLESTSDPQDTLRSLVKIDQASAATSKRLTLENRFQIPLLIGFLLLLIEFTLPEATA